MAKQIELKNLLQELEIATRHHERCTHQLRPSIDECNRAFHAADVAEKRVFSFFDKLNTELEDSTRAYKSLQEQRNYLVQERDEARKAAVEWQNAAQKAKADLQELAQQVMAMKGQAAPNEPFNDARARAGDPIEFRPKYGVVWQDCRYVGTRSTGDVVIEAGESCLSHPVALVRMKSKAPQQLQMFADVFRDVSNGRTYGYLYSEPKSKRPPNAPTMPGIEQLVSDAPVTITVVK